VRGSEEALDKTGVSVGARVGEEGVDLGGRGREAGEIKGDAANERGAVGGGGRGSFSAARRARMKASMGFSIFDL